MATPCPPAFRTDGTNWSENLGKGGDTIFPGFQEEFTRENGDSMGYFLGDHLDLGIVSRNFTWLLTMAQL